MKNFQYDLVVMGSTGFTGRLVVEYLLDHYGVKNKQFSWAIAARDERKLGELKLHLKHRFSDILDLLVLRLRVGVLLRGFCLLLFPLCATWTMTTRPEHARTCRHE